MKRIVGLRVLYIYSFAFGIVEMGECTRIRGFLFFTSSVCLIRRYLMFFFCVPSRTNCLFVSLASVLWQLLAYLVVRAALSMSTHLHLPTALRVFLPISSACHTDWLFIISFVGHSWHAFSIHDSSSSYEHRFFSKRPLDWTTTFRAVATTIFSVCVSVSTSVKHLHFAHCLRKLSNGCEAICWKEQAQYQAGCTLKSRQRLGHQHGDRRVRQSHHRIGVFFYCLLFLLSVPFSVLFVLKFRLVLFTFILPLSLCESIGVKVW